MDSNRLDRMTETTSRAVLPKVYLLCMEERFSDAFDAAVKKLWPQLTERVTFEIHNSSLKYLDPEIRFDAVVSPANSYARLDGAFDDALARAYGPKTDYGWITRLAQKVLYKKYKGFATPGTCVIVPFDQDDTESEQPWGTKYLLLCPTMAVPWDVNWDRQVVYEVVWSLLCAIDEHNQDRRSTGRIDSILMTPLATGIGRISPARWAEQLVLAFKHWIEAAENPNMWSQMQWEDIYVKQDELEKTFIDDVPGPSS